MLWLTTQPTDPVRNAAVVIWLALLVLWFIDVLSVAALREQVKQKDAELGRLRGRLKSKDGDGTDL